MGVGACAVLLTCLFHYEIIRFAHVFVLKKLKPKSSLKVLALAFFLFFAHTVEVWLYALIYLGLTEFGYGALQGAVVEHTWLEYLYYSAASYTTLGIGDIFPHGAHRLITSIEAVNGLLLIAWSATFFYFHMERKWLDD